MFSYIPIFGNVIATKQQQQQSIKLGTKKIWGVLFACSFTKVQGIHRGKKYKTFLKDIKGDTPKNNMFLKKKECAILIMCSFNMNYLFIFKYLL